MFNLKDAAKAVRLEERLKSLQMSRDRIDKASMISITVKDRQGYNPLELIRDKAIEDDRDGRAVRLMFLARYDNAIETVKREFRQIGCAVPGEDA